MLHSSMVSTLGSRCTHRIVSAGGEETSVCGEGAGLAGHGVAAADASPQITGRGNRSAPNPDMNCYGHTCPIFIPSKGRHKGRGTVSLLIQHMVPFTLVVEKQEAENYRAVVDLLVSKWWGGSDCSAPLDVTHAETEGPDLSEVQANARGSVRGVHPPCVPTVSPLNIPKVTDAQRLARGLVKIEVLPLSDQGVSYVRNYILTVLAPAAVAKSVASRCPSCGRATNGAPETCTARWYWVLDDDIAHFSASANNKNIPISPRDAFARVYSQISTLHGSVCNMNEVALFSMEYRQFAYRYNMGDVALNSYNNIASLFRYDLLPQDCRYRFRVREDYDFTLQLILHGLKTARFRNLSFDAPSMAHMPGGMTEYYNTQKDDILEQNKLFVETWPSVASECVKGKGPLLRNDIRVQWRLLNPRHSADPSLVLRSCALPRVAKGRAPHPQNEDGKKASAEDSARQTEGRAGVKKRARSAVRPWEGYIMEDWRYLSTEDAVKLHLHPIPPEKLRIGDTVAVVLPFFHQKPSVTEALLIDQARTRRRSRSKTSDAGEGGRHAETLIEWTAVAKSFPLLTVTECYEIPPEGVEAASAAVDAFFAC